MSRSGIFHKIGCQQLWEEMQPCIMHCILDPYPTCQEMDANRADVFKHAMCIIQRTCGRLQVKPRDCFDAVSWFVMTSGFYHEHKLQILVGTFDIASLRMMAMQETALRNARGQAVAGWPVPSAPAWQPGQVSQGQVVASSHASNVEVHNHNYHVTDEYRKKLEQLHDRLSELEGALKGGTGANNVDPSDPVAELVKKLFGDGKKTN